MPWCPNQPGCGKSFASSERAVKNICATGAMNMQIDETRDQPFLIPIDHRFIGCCSQFVGDIGNRFVIASHIPIRSETG
jgi:hypothetical protein